MHRKIQNSKLSRKIMISLFSAAVFVGGISIPSTVHAVTTVGWTGNNYQDASMGEQANQSSSWKYVSATNTIQPDADSVAAPGKSGFRQSDQDGTDMTQSVLFYSNLSASPYSLKESKTGYHEYSIELPAGTEVPILGWKNASYGAYKNYKQTGTLFSKSLGLFDNTVNGYETRQNLVIANRSENWASMSASAYKATYPEASKPWRSLNGIPFKPSYGGLVYSYGKEYASSLYENPDLIPGDVAPCIDHSTYTGAYNNGPFEAYCAVCGDKITDSLLYASKTAVSDMRSLTIGGHAVNTCWLCGGLEGYRTFSHTCKAQSPNQYFVTYDKNATTATGNMGMTTFCYNLADYYEGETIDVASEVSDCEYSNPGYTFVGWNTKADGSGISYTANSSLLYLQYDEKGNVLSNNTMITLYAQWKINESYVKVDANANNIWNGTGLYDGSQESYQLGAYGSDFEVKKEKVTTPTGYTINFNTNAGSNVNPISATVQITGFYVENPGEMNGIWKSSTNTYTFGKKTGDITEADTIYVEYRQDPITLPGTTKDGYCFVGWYSDQTLNNYVGDKGDTYSPNSNQTLYARWSPIKLSVTDIYFKHTADPLTFQNVERNSFGKAVNTIGTTPTDEKNVWNSVGASSLAVQYNSDQNKHYIYKFLYKGEDESDWSEVPLPGQTENGGGSQNNIYDRTITGSETTWTVESSGFYRLKAMGSRGGSYGSNGGGYPGYIEAVFYLEKGEQITFSTNVGKTVAKSDTDGHGAQGSGGGATRVYSNEKGTLLIAGGGGGASSYNVGGNVGKADVTVYNNVSNTVTNPVIVKGGTGGVAYWGGTTATTSLVTGGSGYTGGYGANVHHHTHSVGCWHSHSEGCFPMTYKDCGGGWTSYGERPAGPGQVAGTYAFQCNNCGYVWTGYPFACPPHCNRRVENGRDYQHPSCGRGEGWTCGLAGTGYGTGHTGNGYPETSAASSIVNISKSNGGSNYADPNWAVSGSIKQYSADSSGADKNEYNRHYNEMNKNGGGAGQIEGVDIGYEDGEDTKIIEGETAYHYAERLGFFTPDKKAPSSVGDIDEIVSEEDSTTRIYSWNIPESNAYHYDYKVDVYELNLSNNEGKTKVPTTSGQNGTSYVVSRNIEGTIAGFYVAYDNSASFDVADYINSHYTNHGLYTWDGQNYSDTKVRFVPITQLNEQGLPYVKNDDTTNSQYVHIAAVDVYGNIGPSSYREITKTNLVRITFNTNHMKYQLSPQTSVSAGTYAGLGNVAGIIVAPGENKENAFYRGYYAVYDTSKTFASNGIFENFSESLSFGGDFPIPTAEGCTFIGWNDKPDGSGTYYSADGTNIGLQKVIDVKLQVSSLTGSQECGQDFTLYAIWGDFDDTTGKGEQNPSSGTTTDNNGSDGKGNVGSDSDGGKSDGSDGDIYGPGSGNGGDDGTGDKGGSGDSSKGSGSGEEGYDKQGIVTEKTYTTKKTYAANGTIQTIDVTTNTYDTSDHVWATSAQVSTSAKGGATGLYSLHQFLLGVDGQSVNRDFGWTGDVLYYTAGADISENKLHTFVNLPYSYVIYRSGTNSLADALYNRKPQTLTETYDVQGTYQVYAEAMSRQAMADLSSATYKDKNGQEQYLQGRGGVKSTWDNPTVLKIDKTQPYIQEYSVTQTKLTDFDACAYNCPYCHEETTYLSQCICKTTCVYKAIQGNLFTTFKASVSDYNDPVNGEVYKNQTNDSSGIAGVYVQIFNEANPEEYHVYQMEKETAGTDYTLFYGNILEANYKLSVNLYAEFPNAAYLQYQIFAIDNAGNISNWQSAPVYDAEDTIKEDEDGNKSGTSTGQPTGNYIGHPGYDMGIGDIENFSIKTMIYNDETDTPEQYNVSEGETYFQVGDEGHVEVWTVGYATGISFEFYEMEEEAEKEIQSGQLLTKYALDSVLDGSWNLRKLPYNTEYVDPIKIKQFTIVDDYNQTYIVSEGDTNRYLYGTHLTEEEINALIPEELDPLLKTGDTIVAELNGKNGIPYAGHWWKDGYELKGMTVRIPPLYAMVPDGTKQEDGTDNYNWERWRYSMTAYKNDWNVTSGNYYILWDTKSNDVHYRTKHES